MKLELEHVHRARGVLAGTIVATPCLRSRTLSEITGAEVFLKFENHQFTASFKERGAGVKIAALLPAERQAGVIAASAGNHAQGVAYIARRHGIPAVIVMPRFTPHVKVVHTLAHGAEVVLHGENFDEAVAHARTIAEARKLTWVHPYDDPLVIAGQGTVALEMLEAQPDLQTLIVPIGGGGLIAGMATAARGLRPDIELVGVQMRRFPAMYCAVKGTSAEPGAGTIAEGIAVKRPGTFTLPIVRALVSDILLVDEADVEAAIVMLVEIEKTVAEGAGAAALAALIANRERFAGKRVGLVLSGGNIDPLVLAGIIARGMVKSGRLTRLQVELRDLPGALAKVTACLAQANANIEEVHHQRAFTRAPVQTAIVDFVLQTRDRDHVEEIIAALAAAGYAARVNNVEES